MFRKSTVAVALLCLAASSRLLALGLGNIESQSVLNAPFKAVIELTSATDEELEQLKISIADTQAFDRVGITRLPILNDFSFKVERSSAGRPVIRITTREPVREPFVEFLLEATWSRGQLVRQYTVLVDPPVTMPARPIAPRAPVTRTPPPAEVAEAAPPVERQPPRPRPVTAPARVAPAPAPDRVADQYGPVRRNETLWNIAKEVRPGSDISMQQMMISLQRANPSAFYRGNINNLKAGAVLRVPERDEILSLTPSQARAEASRQYNEWREARAGRSAPAEAAVAEDTATEQAVAEETVAEEAATEQVVAEEAEPVVETRLQLVAPESEALEGAAVPGEPGTGAEEEAAQPDALSEQLALATEEAEAGRAQSVELQSRVNELEDQVTDLQRLLELKDTQLASLQNRLGVEEQTLQAEEALTESTPADATEGTVIEETLAADAMEETVVEETLAADAAVEPGAEEPPAEEPAADDALEPVVEETATDTEQPNGLVNRLLDNPVLTALGVLVAMILGGFLWASTRRRKPDDIFSEEPTLASRMAELHAGEEAPKPPVEVTDSAILSDLAASDNTLYGDEEHDPLTEADVFLAYGRVQQAEDLIQEALKKKPTDPELKVKLMEIYHAAGNANAFDAHAESFRRTINEDDPRWQKIAFLGYELSPNNHLYQAVAGSQPGTQGGIDIAEIEDIGELPPESEGTADEGLGLDYEAGGKQTGEVVEDIEFGLEHMGAEEEGMAEEEEIEGLLESGDEVSTKLDLARAYLDMQDPEGARSILQEVLEDGNEDQKREADNLMSQLG